MQGVLKSSPILKYGVSDIFQRQKTHHRGHVEFINSALRRLKEFGLHKDLETYKALLNVFPKGALIPRNNFQVSLVFLYAEKWFQDFVFLLPKFYWKTFLKTCDKLCRNLPFIFSAFSCTTRYSNTVALES